MNARVILRFKDILQFGIFEPANNQEIELATQTIIIDYVVLCSDTRIQNTDHI